MNILKFYFILMTVTSLALSGCARRAVKDSGKSGYQPLSETDAKVYTTPTVYYIPQFDLTQQTCDAASRKNIKDDKGAVLFSTVVYDKRDII